MKRYDVIIGGNKTTLLLTDADAAARGLTPAAAPAPEAEAKAVKAPANKARKPANKRAEAAGQAFAAKTGDDE